MKFQVTFEIIPGGPFGVPQDGVTILRGEAGKQFVGDTYHTATMIRVGWGSLPEFRADNEAIKRSFRLGDTQARINDNFLFIELETDSEREAYARAAHQVGTFLKNLSLNQGGLFTVRPLIIETDDGRIFPVPKYSTLGTVTVYSLDQLARNIDEALKYQELSDQRLERAVLYWSHARFLFGKRMEIADPLSEHHTLLISSIFLNLWKAVSTIVGDPSKSADSDYQRRYRRLGFDYGFFRTKIEKIRELRNNYDVAHYSMSEEAIQQIESNFGEADNTATEVLKRYRDHLLHEHVSMQDS
jgi:hypothetical protein